MPQQHEALWELHPPGGPQKTRVKARKLQQQEFLSKELYVFPLREVNSLSAESCSASVCLLVCVCVF